MKHIERRHPFEGKVIEQNGVTFGALMSMQCAWEKAAMSPLT